MVATPTRRALGRVTDLGYAAGWGLVKSMPATVSSRAFRAAADAATVRNGPAARQLRANLRRVAGPGVSELRLDSLVGDALRSYARYWLETFRLESMDHDAIVVGLDESMIGRDHLAAAVARGKGVVIALPHSGNWDIAGLWLVARFGGFTTVAERLEPESLFDRFVAYRESLGMEVIALTGGEQPPTQVLTDRLRAGGVVCLVADRDLSRQGIEVDFFGERARMPGGPALLAARTGASLHTAHTWFAGDGWGQSVSPPLELPAGRLRDVIAGATQDLADRFAAAIAQHPADWHMLQRLWLADFSARSVPQAV